MNLLSSFRDFKQRIESIAIEQEIDDKLMRLVEDFGHLISHEINKTEEDLTNYRMLFDKASDSIFIHSEEGKIELANSTACTNYQYTVNEFLSMTVLDVDAPDQSIFAKERIEQLMINGRICFESMHRRKNGEVFYVDVNASLIQWNGKNAVMSLCRDITQRKETEKALNENEIKFQKIVEEIKDGIIIYEKSGEIIIWNSGAEKITGIKKENALYKKLHEVQFQILHGKYKNKELIAQKFNEAVSQSYTKSPDQIFENDISISENEVRTIQFTIFPIPIEGHDLFGTVIRDVTNNKKIENQLREMNATKDKLFSIIAHDLRSPFSSIIGISDILLNNIDKLDVGKTKTLIEQLKSSAKPTLTVLDNLLDWVRSQTGKMNYKPEFFWLKPILEQMVETMSSSARMKNITLNHFLSNEISVFADQNMLNTILRNLISNAIKFSFENSNIEIYAVQESEYIEFTVSDHGIGMDEERQKELFNLETTQPAKGTVGERGSGLGLILCKEFVEKHGGKIWVESQIGEGSEFKFTIPIASE